MLVKNMVSSKGNPVPNQFIIYDNNMEIFQSYDSIICKIQNGRVYLDSRYYDYSYTTIKYRNKFLNKTTNEIEKKIKDGEYILTNLN